LRQKVWVDQTKCIGCGKCVAVCTNNVFKIVNKKSIAINPENCVTCRACTTNCPTGAVSLAPRDVYAAYARFYKKN